jgi:serine/threonine protein kinase
MAGLTAIGGRFAVRSAIKHSYRGGIFRATDLDTGAEVVLRQARPHAMSPLTGQDARDLLRHEARILERLGPLGLAPRKVAVVAAEEQLFLAREMVPGVTVTAWARDRAASQWRGRGAPLDQASGLIRQIVALVAAVHDQGLVHRDLKPANLMVTPEGQVRLIDLETLVETGARVIQLGTAGYCAPEQETAQGFGPAPGQSADLFSLGVTIMYLASGIEPPVIADQPGGRPAERRLRALVNLAARDMPALARLAPLIRGLTREAPEDRWDLSRARAFLDGLAGRLR